MKPPSQRVRHETEILEALPLSAGFVDANGIIRYVNRYACETRNVTPDQLLGKSVYDVVPPAARETSLEMFRKVLSGETVDQEIPSPRQAGDWLRVLMKPVREADGSIAGFVAIQMDVTARRVAEQRERSTQELLQQILLAAPAGIAYVDQSLRYVFGNEVLARRWGVQPRDLVGRSMQSLFGPAFASAQPHLERVLQGEAVRFELTVDYPTGTRVVDASCVPHRDPSGEVVGLVAAVVDVTERKNRENLLRSLQTELEARVEERTRDLQEVNENLQAFNYMVSHDLRGPLQGILGLLELVRADLGPTSTTAESLAAAVESGRRMQRIIQSLLQLATVSRRELDVRLVDVSSLVSAHVERLRQESPDRAVRLIVPAGLEVRGDPGLVEILFGNLLDNAWKFSARQQKGQIELGASDKDGKRWIFVRDNGVGFSPEHADRLFTAFTRLPNAMTFHGSGIGLATVARIVRRHGGEIRAESEPGRGATFYVWLP